VLCTNSSRRLIRATISAACRFGRFVVAAPLIRINRERPASNEAGSDDRRLNRFTSSDSDAGPTTGAAAIGMKMN
jgi:hypothetical protein